MARAFYTITYAIMATLSANVFGNHSSISLGVLRNGAASDVVRTARESSIGAKHFFTGIRYRAAISGDIATFLPNCPAAVVFEAQARSAFSTIVEAAVEDAREVHATAAVNAPNAVPFNDAASRASAVASQVNRFEAIAVGAVHTSLVLSYELTDADLRPTESKPRILDVEPPAAVADQAACNVLKTTVTHGWTVKLASGNQSANATAAEQTALDMVAFSVDEVELAFAMMALGQAAPVRAGAQLFTDGHHYHSDAMSSTRHKAIEGEVMSTVNATAKNLWRANLTMMRNAVWHAAIHPVKEDVLQGFAEDNDIAARLDATGFGSMSVGLPAQEDLFNRAGSFIAVLNQVRQTASAHGHLISLDKLIDTVTALESLPRTGPLPAMCPALPGKSATAWPPNCTTRAKALKLFLEPALAEAEPVAAWMFGFYKEICSRAGIRSNSPEGSLLRSYSLKRATANYLGEANRAQEMYSARARFIRTQGEAGILEAYSGSA